MVSLAQNLTTGPEVRKMQKFLGSKRDISYANEEFDLYERGRKEQANKWWFDRQFKEWRPEEGFHLDEMAMIDKVRPYLLSKQYNSVLLDKKEKVLDEEREDDDNEEIFAEV